MSENSSIPIWECECSSKNPLRFRKCKSCGREMPNNIKSKIYLEELREQKAFVLVENAEASKRRCLKVGSFLEKTKKVVVPVMIVLVILLNSGRIYLDRANISNYINENIENCQERLWNRVDNVQGTMTGLKYTPLIIETIYFDTATKFKQVDKGIDDNWKTSEKQVDFKKIERAKNKIERAIEYVTNKFE